MKIRKLRQINWNLSKISFRDINTSQLLVFFIISLICYIIPFIINYFLIIKNLIFFSFIPEGPSLFVNPDFNFLDGFIISIITSISYLSIEIIFIIILKQKNLFLNLILISHFVVFCIQSILLIALKTYFTTAYFLYLQGFMILIYGITCSLLIFLTISREHSKKTVYLFTVQTINLLFIPSLFYSIYQHFENYSRCEIWIGSCDYFLPNYLFLRIFLFVSFFFLFASGLSIIITQNKYYKLHSILVFPHLIILFIVIINLYVRKILLDYTDMFLIILIVSIAIYVLVMFEIVLRIYKRPKNSIISIKSLLGKD